MTDSIVLDDIDVQTVRDLINDATTAQNDPAALLPLHSPDAVVVNFGGRRILGRDAFGEAMGAALATPLRDVSTEVEIVDIRPVADGVVLASCLKRVRDQREAAADDPLRASDGALSYLLVRSNGGWQISLAQTTPILS